MQLCVRATVGQMKLAGCKNFSLIERALTRSNSYLMITNLEFELSHPHFSKSNQEKYQMLLFVFSPEQQKITRKVSIDAKCTQKLCILKITQSILIEYCTTVENQVNNLLIFHVFFTDNFKCECICANVDKVKSSQVTIGYSRMNRQLECGR